MDSACAPARSESESGLTQLTDLAPAAFNNGVGQSGEHSEAAAVSAARRDALPALTRAGATLIVGLIERARGHEGVFIDRPDLDPHLAAACFRSLRALAHAASRIALTGVILELTRNPA